MQVLSLVNQKGGCGKTTVAVNLAAALAARGERVLLVDLDPQGHATMALGQAPLDDEPTLAEVLVDGLDPKLAVRPAPGGVALLAADERLAEFEEVAERSIRPESRLAHALARLEERYDHALLDCPPRADGVLAANALCASDLAVLVVETGAFALQGAVKALRILTQVGEAQGRALEVAVLATLFDRKLKIAREILVALHARFGPAMFDTVIRQNVRLREAPAVGLPVQLLDPASRGASDFAALAEELLARQAASGRATGRRAAPPPARASLGRRADA